MGRAGRGCGRRARFGGSGRVDTRVRGGAGPGRPPARRSRAAGARRRHVALAEPVARRRDALRDQLSDHQRVLGRGRGRHHSGDHKRRHHLVAAGQRGGRDLWPELLRRDALRRGWIRDGRCNANLRHHHNRGRGRSLGAPGLSQQPAPARRELPDDHDLLCGRDGRDDHGGLQRHLVGAHVADHIHPVLRQLSQRDRVLRRRSRGRDRPHHGRRCDLDRAEFHDHNRARGRRLPEHDQLQRGRRQRPVLGNNRFGHDMAAADQPGLAAVRASLSRHDALLRGRGRWQRLLPESSIGPARPSLDAREGRPVRHQLPEPDPVPGRGQLRHHRGDHQRRHGLDQASRSE